MSHGTLTAHTWHTHKQADLSTCSTSHVTHINESWHTHMNESRHTHGKYTAHL